MKDIMRSFELKTKKEFKYENAFVRIGERHDMDARLGIIAGFLELSGLVTPFASKSVTV